MDRRILVGAVICSALLATPALAATPSNGTENYYTPPKLVKPGRATVPVTGPGTVVVQVLVKTDGSFVVQKVLRSTNHGDDAAALDVAKHSTYTPAKRGNKTLVAYYDYTLKFKAGATMADAPATGVALFEREIRAGNYSSAQTGLTAYLADHASDSSAQMDLGVADTYLGDYAGATAAFDEAGPIGDTYKAVAGKAYAEYAAAALKSKDAAKAVAAAKRAAEIQPSFLTFNTLGFAEYSAGDYTASIADLEKARGLAQSSSAKAHDRIAVDDNLLSAYLADGKPDQAKAIVAEIAQIDPSDTSAQNIMATAIVKEARAAQEAGKQSDAAALYEQAASSAPSQAATLYVNAAFAYLAVKPSAENDKAKTDADKVLVVDANDAGANFVEGIVLANTGKPEEALKYLNKASLAAKQANDASLGLAIDRAIKQLSDKNYGKQNADPKMQY